MTKAHDSSSSSKKILAEAEALQRKARLTPVQKPLAALAHPQDARRLLAAQRLAEGLRRLGDHVPRFAQCLFPQALGPRQQQAVFPPGRGVDLKALQLGQPLLASASVMPLPCPPARC